MPSRRNHPGLARSLLAIVSIAAAAAVYRSSVSSDFAPRSQAIVTSEFPASRHAVRVVLPARAVTAGQRLVLVLRLRNASPDERLVSVWLGGLLQSEVKLAPYETARADVAVSPGVGRALAADADEASRSLTLSSDGDGWSLRALEARNYHFRCGGRAGVTVLPARTDLAGAGAGFPVAAVVIVMLGVGGAAFTPRRSRAVRLISDAIAAMALGVLGVCLLLPGVSPYRAALAPWAFYLVTAALFSPFIVRATWAVLIRARRLVRRLLATVVSRVDAASRRLVVLSPYWHRHRITLERGTALLALTALAVAQPVFDVIADSPEFFVARNTRPTTAIVVTGVMGVGVPLVLLAIERFVRLVSVRAAAALFGVVLAALGAALVMPWLKRGGVVAWPWDAVASVATGAALAAVYARWRPVRQFLSVLSLGAIVVPAAFLLDESVQGALLPRKAAGIAQSLGRTPPIVVVVFDEFPLNSLLDERRQIDARRYPNFAELARRSYWFRNAGTVSSETRWAVPAIVSGRYPTVPHDLPTLEYYPVNLFTLLAREYDMVAFMRFRKLCPEGACRFDRATPRETVPSLLSDLSIVWLHIVLPQPATEQLPPIVGDWLGFGRPREARRGANRGHRGREFVEFLESIDGEPGRLYFLHLLLPHMPFEYVPSGRRYRAPDYQVSREQGKWLFDHASAAYADTLHQRHLAQVGYIDRLIGELMQRLRAVGVDDTAIVVVTADHGASFREGRPRRAATSANLADIALVPLLIKVPGQRQGEIVDRSVEVVDILPTILDVLQANSPPPTDGRSALRQDQPPSRPRTFIFRGRANVVPRTVDDLTPQAVESLRRKVRRFGSGDPSFLYATPATRHLLGARSADLPVAEAEGVELALEDASRFAAVDLADDVLPLYVRGTVAGSERIPRHVGIAVNGVLVAVTQPYSENGTYVFGTLIPESSLHSGRNTVAAVIIDEAAAETWLQ